MMSVTLTLAPNWVPVPQAVAPMVSFLSWENPGIAINISTPSKMRNLDTLELANIVYLLTHVSVASHIVRKARVLPSREAKRTCLENAQLIRVTRETALSGSDDKGQEMPIYRPQDGVRAGGRARDDRKTCNGAAKTAPLQNASKPSVSSACEAVPFQRVPSPSSPVWLEATR